MFRASLVFKYLSARGAALVVGILPVAFVPLLAAVIDIQKGVLAVIGCGIVLGAFAFSPSRALFSKEVLRSGVGLILIGLCLLASVSAVFSLESAWQLFGVGFEVGSVGFFFVLLLFFLFGARSGIAGAFYALTIWCSAVGIALALALGSYFFGARGESFFTLLGEWPHLSVALSLCLFFCALFLDEGRGSRALLHVGGIVLLVSNLLFFHVSAAIAFIVAAIAYAGVRYGETRRLTLYTFSISVLFLILLVFGMRTPALDMPPSVRMSLFLNEVVAAPVFMVGSPDVFFGVGPGQFSHAWEVVRPIEMNATPLWQDAFWKGYSTLGTFVVELGFFFILLFLALCIVLFRALVAARSSEERILLGGALFCVAATVLYSISIPLLVLGIYLLGALAPTSEAPRYMRARLLTAGLFVLGGLFLIWVALLQLFASHMYMTGVVANEAGRLEDAHHSLTRAAVLWPSDLYAREAARALTEVAFQTSGENERRALLAEAVTHSNESIAADPHNYWNWIARAGLLVSFVSAGYVEVSGDAEEALRQAYTLSPTRPEPLYLSAVYAHTAQKNEQALEYLAQALALKADYEPALLLKAELDGTLSP